MNLKEKYIKQVGPKIKEELGLKNVFQAPKIEKVVINVGLGKFLNDSNQVEEIKESLAVITGQRSVKTKARLSIAGFKIREGMEVGLKVTLRGNKMWNFLEKLIFITLPRIRDFKGLKKSAIDQNGNLNIGIKEHLVFPEIMPEKVKNIFSFQITVVTSSAKKEVGEKLFKLLGFPIENINLDNR